MLENPSWSLRLSFLKGLKKSRNSLRLAANIGARRANRIHEKSRQPVPQSVSYPRCAFVHTERAAADETNSSCGGNRNAIVAVTITDNNRLANSRPHVYASAASYANSAATV